MSNDNGMNRVPDAVLVKQRRSALSRVFGSLFALVFSIGVLAAIALGWAWMVFTNPGPLTEPKVVNLAQGLSRTEIANTLKDQGVIADARVMSGASLVNSMRGATLKPGEYEFPAGATMAEVMNIIASGRVITYKLTVPEGWTSTMALGRINENDVLSGDPVSEVPEGAIMADTFVFRRGMTRAKLVEDMQAAQKKLVEEIWAKRPADSPLKSKEEMVTLASIVEKETSKPEERPQVAAVFLNRLKQHMRLQSDPTIIYGIVGGLGKLDRPLTRADIDSATAYNTYQIDGLPPGPIASPGRASLEAVVAPAPTQDIYFVADGTGGHAFAATLDEHNANVKKWRVAQKNGIELPGAADVTAAAPPANTVEQAPLPALEEPAPAAPAVAAAQAAAEPQAIPAPDNATAGQQPDKTVPLAAEPPPLPVEKKVKPETKQAAAETAAPAQPAAETPPAADLQPGSVIKLGDRLVPIPLQKKKKK